MNKILSHTADTIRILSGRRLYTITGINPFVLKEVKRKLKYGQIGRMWTLLEHYSIEGEDYGEGGVRDASASTQEGSNQ